MPINHFRIVTELIRTDTILLYYNLWKIYILCMFDVDQDAHGSVGKSLLVLSFFPFLFIWDAKVKTLLKVILTIQLRC